MKLFISYSRDDKTWVYLLWQALLQEGHQPWIDRDIPPSADWWGTICHNIKDCDCFLYIMTPESVSSIYCLGEMRYAIALSKPILPLMRKQADFPPELNNYRIQFEDVTGDLDMNQVLLKIEKGLSEVRFQMARGEYPTNDVDVPDVPKPQRNPQHIDEVYALAEEIARDGNMVMAKQLFTQVMELEPDGLGAAAKERLAEIEQEKDHATAYENVKRLARNPVTVRGAQITWRVFERTYPNYDPDNLVALLNGETTPSVPQPSASVVTSSGFTNRSRMPAPFDWIEIPGKGYSIAKYPVTNAQFAAFMEAGGYKQDNWWTEAGRKERNEANWTQPRYWEDSNFNGTDQPVVGVSWYEAVAFCLWLSDITGENIMLPTEDQWQYAAQGDDRRRYPWGNEWDCTRCNNSVDPCDSQSTTPVQHYEGKGDSPFGVVDMAGNAWDWCLTDYENKTNQVRSIAKNRVLRGGSWRKFSDVNFRCGFRAWFTPTNRADNWSFRPAIS